MILTLLSPIWRPAKQNDVNAKSYWGENRISYNHSNTSIVSVVTSLYLAGLHKLVIFITLFTLYKYIIQWIRDYVGYDM